MTGYEGPRTRINLLCVKRCLHVLDVAKEVKIILEEIKEAMRSCWGPCALPVWFQRGCSRFYINAFEKGTDKLGRIQGMCLVLGHQ